MAFDVRMAAVLTGTTVSQLRRWRREDVFEPEVPPADGGGLQYSYRDLMALRTIAFLRAKISLQRIRLALSVLRKLSYDEHLSAYKFGADSRSVVLADEDGNHIELVGQPGQLRMFTFGEIFAPFTNLHGDNVVPFQRPMPHLEVDADKMGGWPTIANTRVAFDAVAGIVDGDTITVDQVSHFFPTVTTAAAQDAIRFDDMVRAAR
ncbi:DUF433 domain-containing protein [Arthrobacter halodurans]|uniref:DUF433 domain-containing protein n=1 Tax=Arthrobacter halodurans TaxID=516699 RepID=A0ABV4UPX8_9MICC